MITWNIAFTVTLDQEISDDVAQAVAQRTANDGFEPIMVTVHGTRLGLRVLTEAYFPNLALLRSRISGALSEVGFAPRQWEAVEALTADESERRLSSVSAPTLVTVAEFAELCGVAAQRIHDLETERGKAETAGRKHDFPKPLAKGVWLKLAAERYAQTRKRTPGPPRRDPK
ncbi:hypothetical protein [Amycolatopsis alba]|uniref:Uncharacterized protein n=1 Tax=Amycolatopsis alba DSM 44262 TaxID=1125972 RepID=A0A229RGP5_AMYAL|nr:hypothetical protein [Amycolatopsis alba]OXM45669.1 hypothetical protein CFP75_30235 [Amycolatopsis alba DSM 44262]